VQQLLDCFGALHEARVHRLEVHEELGDVLEELAPEYPVGHLVEGTARDVQHPRATASADAVRHGQPPQQPATEEVAHARGRLEEVDRVSRRGRVDDDQVVLAARVEVEEALHRDVVVALHEARRDVVVQAIVEDAVGGRLIRCVPQHEFVPGALRVEHGGVELPARFLARVRRQIDAALDVAERLDAERVGEPARGIDCEHEHLPADSRRRRDRGCRRDRRLAHSAGPAEHRDLARREQRLERLARGHQ
jgi:hypothetical protein